jgi:hypothetical protein
VLRNEIPPGRDPPGKGRKIRKEEEIIKKNTKRNILEWMI